MMLIHHSWSLLLSLAIVLPWHCAALPANDGHGSTSRDDQESMASLEPEWEEVLAEHPRTEGSNGGSIDYRLDHESCRSEMTDILVKRAGCLKRVSIGVCSGMCMSKPVFLKTHPFVKYPCSKCFPVTSKPYRVDMNDQECRQQRLEKGKEDKNKSFSNIFLLSATSCSCQASAIKQ
eukprot:scpid97997/ scgid6878/ 